MVIRFWGVRGSLPSPIRPSEVRAKISAILDHMVPEDLANAESKQRFLDELPPWLYSTVGGNSPCISVHLDGFNEPIIFDCGSGLREMGHSFDFEHPETIHYHILFSHLHWDHIMGFPFFKPAYNSSVCMDLYWPGSGLEEYISGMMKEPYFPVQLDNMAARKNFHVLENPLIVGSASISYKVMSHPGASYSYLINHNGKRIIYATDAELSAGDFVPNDENTAFFKDADLIILDAQYTLGEAIDKYNWGHSAFSLSVDFAANWGIKHLVLFHHDPNYDDRKLNGILQSARWYHDRMEAQDMEISLATEGLEISI